MFLTQKEKNKNLGFLGEIFQTQWWLTLPNTERQKKDPTRGKHFWLNTNLFTFIDNIKWQWDARHNFQSNRKEKNYSILLILELQLHKLVRILLIYVEGTFFLKPRSFYEEFIRILILLVGLSFNCLGFHGNIHCWFTIVFVRRLNPERE